MSVDRAVIRMTIDSLRFACPICWREFRGIPIGRDGRACFGGDEPYAIQWGSVGEVADILTYCGDVIACGKCVPDKRWACSPGWES